MNSNLNKPKVRVIGVLAMIALLVILVLTANFIKNNIVVNKIHENTNQGSANLVLEKVSEEKIIMHAIVKPGTIVKSKQIGYISKVCEDGGKRYLNFDDVEFLTGNAAIEAGKKSGDAVYENGKYFVYDDYIIVNSSKEIKSYVIADNASLNLLGCWLDSYRGDINNQSVSYDDFKSVSIKYEHMLCYIYSENDLVVKVEGQYTP
ncbi:hypothetical protein [Clostridium sp.]|uniref:hypothetical protein n=1 Tax=Clostridium sp. TaxID=1506 RepID=UPI001A57B547|nr:hypothetical protein [Clostridium sp.]MBK5235370.1 hypothetical protein [Clostridium sp.]